MGWGGGCLRRVLGRQAFPRFFLQCRLHGDGGNQYIELPSGDSHSCF